MESMELSILFLFYEQTLIDVYRLNSCLIDKLARKCCNENEQMFNVVYLLSHLCEQ